jgi:hypothetical protein
MSLACHIHPSSSAEDRCEVCRRAICPVCVVTLRKRTACRSCAQRIDLLRRRLRVRLLLAAGLLASAALLALLLVGG